MAPRHLERRLGVSPAACAKLRQRWRSAGWTDAELLSCESWWTWLTPAGVRIADVPFAAGPPHPGRLAHTAAATDVRLWVEGRRPSALWISERELGLDTASHMGTGLPHRPDALVIDEGQTVAVEVELSLKAPKRLEAIVHSHLSRYAAVWYFAAPRPTRLLQQLTRFVGDGRLQVLPLPGG